MASAAQRLAAADEAYRDGDIWAASLVYARIGNSRSAGPVAVAARERLAKLAEEAVQRMGEIDAMLASPPGTSDGSPSLSSGAVPPAEVIEAAFVQYDELNERYGAVPAVKSKLAAHIRRQQNRPEFAAVLKEPEAKKYLAIARQHEENGEICCAYWAYEQASLLVPAASALDALVRFQELGEDSQRVAEAVACRNIRWCLAEFERASRLEKSWPRKAKEIYQEVLRRAPPESGVYRAAGQQYDALASTAVE